MQDRIGALALVALLLAPAACNQGEAAPAPGISAKPAATPAASADGCSASAYRNEKYGFCLELPPNYKPAENNASPGDDQQGRFRWLYDGPDRDRSYGEIDVEATAHAEGSDPWQLVLLDSDKKKGDRKIAEESALPSKGGFVVLTGKLYGADDYTFVHSAVSGPKYSIGCAANGDPKKKAAALAAAKSICKSLRAR